MKKLLVFVLPMLLLLSCDNVTKHKAAIDELGSNWDATTSAVGGFSTMINSFVSDQNKAAAGFNLSEEVMKNATPEMLQQFEGAKTGLMTSLAAFNPLRNALGEFTKEWTDKGAEVTALKDGLAAGKIEGDVAAKVASLTEYMTGATDKFTAMQETFSGAKANTEASSSALQTVFASIMEAATAKMKK